MNLIGAALLGKALKNMESSSGRGRYHRDNQEGPSLETCFLIDCKSIIAECSKMPSMDGTKIPIKNKNKGKDPKTGKRMKTEERSIFFSDINPEGIKIEGVSFDSSKFSAIGMIDYDKVFCFNAKTEQLDVMKIKAQYSYGPHDDYCTHYDLVDSEPKKETYPEALLVDIWSIANANDIKYQYDYIRNYQEQAKVFKKLMELTGHIREKRKTLLKAEAESQTEEDGIEMQ